MVYLGTVYLPHFDRPSGNMQNRRAQARHYVGWTVDLEERLKEHAAGSGAKLMAAVVAAGVGWKCVRTWERKTRRFERRLKNTHRVPSYCPHCAGADAIWREPKKPRKK